MRPSKRACLRTARALPAWADTRRSQWDVTEGRIGWSSLPASRCPTRTDAWQGTKTSRSVAPWGASCLKTSVRHRSKRRSLTRLARLVSRSSLRLGVALLVAVTFIFGVVGARLMHTPSTTQGSFDGDDRPDARAFVLKTAVSRLVAPAPASGRATAPRHTPGIAIGLLRADSAPVARLESTQAQFRHGGGWLSLLPRRAVEEPPG